MIAITYDIAHACGWDAGNANMRKHGRAKWNEEDKAIASQVMNDILDKHAFAEEVRHNENT